MHNTTLRASVNIPFWLLAVALFGLLTACSALDPLTVDVQAGVETRVFQTRQISELETAAASGSGAGDTAASTPQSTTDPAANCPAAPAPPDFSSIALPESLGPLMQQSGQWYLNGAAVDLINHVNADCSVSLWLTLQGQTTWPLLVRKVDSGWQLGNAYWTGRITVINTNDTPLTLGILPIDAITVEDNDPTYQDLTAYELFQFADLPPGGYLFTFSFQGDQAFNLGCSLDLQPDTRLVFSVVSIGVAVFQEGFVPQAAADIDLTTSPLCTN